MLLLHGFTGSGAAWPAAIVEGLTSHGIVPQALDLPGHGRFSGDADPACFTLERAFAAIDEALAGVPGAVAGYSMGGRVALAYAVAHPGRVTHLVLESSSPGLATEAERTARRAADARIADRIERDGLAAFVRSWESMPLFESQAALPESMRAAQRTRRLANQPRGLAGALRGLGTGALPSRWNDLSTLETPTLILAGALDRKFVAIGRAMAERMPHSRLVEVPRAGHAVHLERPHAWVSAVLESAAAL